MQVSSEGGECKRNGWQLDKYMTCVKFCFGYFKPLDEQKLFFRHRSIFDHDRWFIKNM